MVHFNQLDKTEVENFFNKLDFKKQGQVSVENLQLHLSSKGMNVAVQDLMAAI